MLRELCRITPVTPLLIILPTKPKGYVKQNLFLLYNAPNQGCYPFKTIDPIRSQWDPSSDGFCSAAWFLFTTETMSQM